MCKWVTFNKVQQNSLGGNVGVAVPCIPYEEHSFGARGSDRFKILLNREGLG